MKYELNDINIKILKINNTIVTLFITLFDKKVPDSLEIISFYLKHYFDVTLNKKDFYYSKNGKPYLKSNEIYFSFSNKNNLHISAISKSEIGVDVEYVNLNREIRKISDKYFFQNEIEYIYKPSDLKEIYERFYQVWTKKEAILKFRDMNISDIKSIDTSKDTVYSFKYNDYIISIAV